MDKIRLLIASGDASMTCSIIIAVVGEEHYESLNEIFNDDLQNILVSSMSRGIMRR